MAIQCRSPLSKRVSHIRGVPIVEEPGLDCGSSHSTMGHVNELPRVRSTRDTSGIQRIKAGHLKRRGDEALARKNYRDAWERWDSNMKVTGYECAHLKLEKRKDLGSFPAVSCLRKCCRSLTMGYASKPQYTHASEAATARCPDEQRQLRGYGNTRRNKLRDLPKEISNRHWNILPSSTRSAIDEQFPANSEVPYFPVCTACCSTEKTR